MEGEVLRAECHWGWWRAAGAPPPPLPAKAVPTLPGRGPSTPWLCGHPGFAATTWAHRPPITSKKPKAPCHQGGCHQGGCHGQHQGQQRRALHHGQQPRCPQQVAAVAAPGDPGGHATAWQGRTQREAAAAGQQDVAARRPRAQRREATGPRPRRALLRRCGAGTRTGGTQKHAGGGCRNARRWPRARGVAVTSAALRSQRRRVWTRGPWLYPSAVP